MVELNSYTAIFGDSVTIIYWPTAAAEYTVTVSEVGTSVFSDQLQNVVIVLKLKIMISKFATSSPTNH